MTIINIQVSLKSSANSMSSMAPRFVISISTCRMLKRMHWTDKANARHKDFLNHYMPIDMSA